MPLLLLARRRAVLVSSATASLVLVSLTALVLDLRRPLLPAAALIAGLVLAGVLVRTRQAPLPTRTLVVSAALPAALWPLQLAALAVSDAVRWPVELWTGVVIVSVGVALLIGGLSLGPDRARGNGLPPA